MSHRSYNLRSSGVKPSRRGERYVEHAHAGEYATYATTFTTTSSNASGSADRMMMTHGDGNADALAQERTATPAPVQRTLYMHGDELDEEEEEDDDYEDDDELDHEPPRMRAPGFAFVMHPPGGSDEDEWSEGELDEDQQQRQQREQGQEEEEEDDEAEEAAQRRARMRRRTPGKSPFQRLRQHAAPLGLLARVLRSEQVQKVIKAVRHAWQYLLRNSFMTANVLWLLVPIGCLLLAILVPAYLTTAVRYVDVLATSASAPQVDLAYEKGMMRSVVQEIVEVKLSSMQAEINTLQNTIVSQAREIEGLRLLHESVRQVVEENQKKMSIGDTNSMLSIHIEHTINRHAEGLWRKFQDKIETNDELLQTTANHQSTLAKTVARQQEDIKRLLQTKRGESTSSKSFDETALRHELDDWKSSLQKELQTAVQQEVISIEDRMHKSLLNEKKVLVDSVANLKKLDAENPALVSMIASAVVEADIKKAGSVDFAALANGACVVRSKANFFDASPYSPAVVVHKLIGHDESAFTSSSFRPMPLFSLSSLLPWQDSPWWLSRHNGRPETALSETMEIGSCWGIRGSSGRLTVRFATPIVAESLTLDHIPHQVATDFSSAPRDFRLLGITVDKAHESIHFTPLGNFSYTKTGPASQTFMLTSSLSRQLVIDGATLEITSNHGHSDYTCLYRFRVHGHASP